MSRWGDTSSDEEHHHHNSHNDEANQEATPENVEVVSGGTRLVALPLFLVSCLG